MREREYSGYFRIACIEKEFRDFALIGIME
jgi:hypothetical protein